MPCRAVRRRCVVVDLRKFGSELLLVVERIWADRVVECGPWELPVALA
jgi:hypothetical protein